MFKVKTKLLYIFMIILFMGCRAKKETIDHQLTAVTTHKLTTKKDSIGLKVTGKVIDGSVKTSKETKTYTKQTVTDFDKDTGKPVRKTVTESGVVESNAVDSVKKEAQFDNTWSKLNEGLILSDSTNVVSDLKSTKKTSGNRLAIIGVCIAVIFLSWVIYKLVT